MKKVITACLCLMMILALATTVFAAGASFEMKTDAKNLSRGDTFTINVSVACSEKAPSYGLKLEYDTSVFEVVTGKCKPTDDPTEVWFKTFDADKGFAFLYPEDEPTAYTGTVGYVTLKVKEDAPIGEYTITGVASVEGVEATGSSVKVSVVCAHDYSAWADNDEWFHAQTCVHCGDQKHEAHIWGQGEVATAATCTEPGVKTYTCSTCGRTKTETIPSTGHNYDDGKVTTAATCTADGVMTFTCGNCATTYTDVIAATGHNYDKITVTTEATCETDGVKTIACSNCGDSKTEAIPATGHEIILIEATEPTHLEEGNIAYYGCVNCYKGYADENATQELTDEDVFIPTIPHEFGEELVGDDECHFHACECGARADEEAHTYGEWILIQEVGVGVEGIKERTCSVCNYKQVEKTPAASTPATGDETQTGMMIATMVISICGLLTLAYFGFQKKTNV